MSENGGERSIHIERALALAADEPSASVSDFGAFRTLS
jgi:hypothetical protein